MSTFWSMKRRRWKVLLDLLRGKTNSETRRGLIFILSHTYSEPSVLFSAIPSLSAHPFCHILPHPTTPAPSLSGLYGGKKNLIIK